MARKSPDGAYVWADRRPQGGVGLVGVPHGSWSRSRQGIGVHRGGLCIPSRGLGQCGGARSIYFSPHQQPRCTSPPARASAWTRSGGAFGLNEFSLRFWINPGQKWQDAVSTGTEISPRKSENRNQRKDFPPPASARPTSTDASHVSDTCLVPGSGRILACHHSRNLP